MATALILGATSDMAAAIANAFAARKFNIQLAARNTDQLLLASADIAIRYQVICTVHAFNALDFNSHQQFFTQLQPKPEVTICVFGYLGENEKAMADEQETATILNTNYTGAVSVLNAAARYYAAVKSGTIAGISSVAGVRGRQSNYMYGSAKAGFTAYLSGLRNRLYREHVHVLTVLPGFVYTRMTESLNLPKLLTALPQEVGEAVYQAVVKKKNIIYVRWFWRWIMLLISFVPESMFKKLKL